MKIIVVGCGRVGAELVGRLCRQGHEVVVIDSVQAAFNNLPADFRGRNIEGDALNQDVLHRAGIEHADALAAVTNSDALNAVVAYVAKTVYNVPTIVVRNYEPLSRPIYEVMGLQVVSSTSWGAQRIEELLYNSNFRTVFSAGNGEVEVYEVIVTDTISGMTLGKLLECGDCTAISVTRAGRAFLPQANTVLEKGDLLHVSATFDGIERLQKAVDGKKEA